MWSKREQLDKGFNRQNNQFKKAITNNQFMRLYLEIFTCVVKNKIFI